jgi:hypothetical protein
LQDKGNGRGSSNGKGNNSINNNVTKGSNTRRNIEAVHGEQLLLNSFLKKLAFIGVSGNISNEVLACGWELSVGRVH